MAAGLSDWRKKIEDIVALLDADYEATRPKTRGAVQEAHGGGRHGGLTVVRVPLHCLCVSTEHEHTSTEHEHTSAVK